MFDGLETIDWSGLTHAYGSAADIPDLLRALATDPGWGADALTELLGSLWHQGTVYPATVAAVPFLVEAAGAAPRHRADILAAVGMVADPHHAHGERAESVRAAVAGQAGRVYPLLDDPRPQVRAATAYLLAQCRPDAVVEPLWRRWTVEESAAVRAGLLLALGVCDPVAGAAAARVAVLDAPPPVRVAAALALLRADDDAPTTGTRGDGAATTGARADEGAATTGARAGGAPADDAGGAGWPAGAAAALAPALAAGVDVDHTWRYRGPARTELLTRAGDRFAVELAGRLLADPGPPVRRATIQSLAERLALRRSAPAWLVPRLALLLADPDRGVREEAVAALRRAGRAAGACADALAATAGGYPAVAGDVAITAESRAVQTLALLGDPRWLGPVCAAWAAGHDARAVTGRLPFDPVVLAEVRRRLAAAEGPAAAVAERVVTGLAQVVRGWGPVAGPATPELLAALPRAPRPVAVALAALGTLTPATTGHLRAAALTGDVDAGVALWRLDGDPAAVVAAVRWHLDRGGWIGPPVARAAPAGAALGELVPRLRGYLTGVAASTWPQREVQVAAAHLVALATGDPASVLPTVLAVLAAGGAAARGAAELAGLVAAPPGQGAGAALVAALRARLHGVSAVAAARALWRLGEPANRLVPPLVAAVERGHDGAGAARLLVEMAAVSAVPVLVRLAERDARLGTAGTADDIAWDDEQVRDELRAAITALRTP